MKLGSFDLVTLRKIMITKNGVQKLLLSLAGSSQGQPVVNLLVKDLKRVENEKVAARLKLTDEATQ